MQIRKHRHRFRQLPVVGNVLAELWRCGTRGCAFSFEQLLLFDRGPY